MAEQHRVFAEPLGTCGAHIIATDLFEEYSAIPARTGTDAADDADDHGQHQKLDAIEARRIARDRHPVPYLAHDPLPADDVKQARHRHQRHAQHGAVNIQRRTTKEHQQQRKRHGDEQAQNKGRHRNRQRRPHAVANLARDVAAVIGAAKIKGEHAH